MPEALGDYGVAIAVIAGAVFIVRFVRDMVITVAKIWRENAHERGVIEKQQTAILQDITARLERICTVDQGIVLALNQVVTGFETQQTSLNGIQRSVKAEAVESTRQLSSLQESMEAIPGQVVGQLAIRLDALPAEVRDSLQDDLVSIKSKLASVADQLTSIFEAVDSFEQRAVAALTPISLESVTAMAGAASEKASAPDPKEAEKEGEST
jgi:hypothetical protein